MNPEVASSRRAPGPTERRVFAGLSVAYATLLLGVLPFSALPSIENPHVAAVSGAGVLFADLCTALLLASEYRYSGRRAFLWLTCAYMYGGLMAALHVLTFPGALHAGSVVGNAQTVSWLFALWRAGTAALLVAGVLSEQRRTQADPAQARNARLGRALALTAAAAAALGALFVRVEMASVVGNTFTGATLWINWLTVGAYLAGAAIIWRRQAFGDALYLWLALVLVAQATDLTLSTAAGARYTLGWYLGRASWVISACLLLVLWLTHESSATTPRRLRAFTAYGSALCLLVAALLLHWFLLPWLKGAFPFATVFGAVAIAVWLGGWGPGALTAALGYVAASTYFMEPYGRLELADPSHALGLVLFCLSCSVIIGLGEAMRRARDAYRQSEAELQVRASQLEQADTNKSNFLAVLSHELRNPMAPLRNSLTILDRSPDRQTIGKVMPIMDRQLSHLTRLIDDLLDVSRIDRGKLELRHDRLSIDSVVKSAIETAKPNIEAKSHELVVRYPAQPVYVQGDAVRLTQVVSNLLNNAAKFTPPRGEIEITMRTEGGNALVIVADSGIGIPRADLPRIFDMFVQLDSSRTVAAAGGLGIGLTLARSIAEIHGGTLEAHSEGPGKGSRFVLRLPAAAAPADERGPEPAAHAAPGRQRVLVVDDNEDAASTLAELLRMEGHEVRVAFDGAAALREAQEHPPAVAFVDLNMPGMDGFELAARMRRDRRTCDARLVALTGMGQRADIARTREAGFIAHLTKPASPEDVLRLAAGRGAAVVNIR